MWESSAKDTDTKTISKHCGEERYGWKLITQSSFVMLAVIAARFSHYYYIWMSVFLCVLSDNFRVCECVEMSRLILFVVVPLAVITANGVSFLDAVVC